MTLGDSITERPEYRLQLTQQLLDGGCSVDFLGSQVDQGFVDIGPWLDPNHEGHGGLRADEIAANTASWARSAPPEIVLLHVGTNDFYQNQSPANVVGDIEQIISSLRGVNPNVTVLVAQILPGVGIEDLADDLNGRLVGMKNRLDWAESRIVLVDQNSGFDVEADTWDKVHPNQSGGLKMANRWMSALRPLVADACENL